MGGLLVPRSKQKGHSSHNQAPEEPLPAPTPPTLVAFPLRQGGGQTSNLEGGTCCPKPPPGWSLPWERRKSRMLSVSSCVVKNVLARSRPRDPS